MSESKLVVTKIIQATPEEVFEAFTDSEIMAEWFYGDEGWTADVFNTLEVGGIYNVTMHAANGKSYVHTGEYRVIEPPEKLVFTWNSDFVQNTVVTVHFRRLGEGTEITLEHEFLPTPEEREDHRRGWTVCLGNLGRLYT